MVIAVEYAQGYRGRLQALLMTMQKTNRRWEYDQTFAEGLINKNGHPNEEVARALAQGMDRYHASYVSQFAQILGRPPNRTELNLAIGIAAAQQHADEMLHFIRRLKTPRQRRPAA